MVNVERPAAESLRARVPRAERRDLNATERVLQACIDPRQRGAARRAEARVPSGRFPIDAPIHITDADRDRMDAQECPPVRIVPVPHETRLLIRSRRERIFGDSTSKPHVELDPVEARRHGIADERDHQLPRRDASRYTVTAIVECERRTSNSDALAQRLVLTLYNGASLTRRVILVLALVLFVAWGAASPTSTPSSRVGIRRLGAVRQRLREIRVPGREMADGNPPQRLAGTVEQSQTLPLGVIHAEGRGIVRHAIAGDVQVR